MALFLFLERKLGFRSLKQLFNVLAMAKDDDRVDGQMENRKIPIVRKAGKRVRFQKEENQRHDQRETGGEKRAKGDQFG